MKQLLGPTTCRCGRPVAIVREPGKGTAAWCTWCQREVLPLRFRVRPEGAPPVQGVRDPYANPDNAS